MKKYLIKQLYCEDNYIFYEDLINDLENNYNSDVMIGGNKDYCGVNYDTIKIIEEEIINYNDYDLQAYYNNNIAALIIDVLKMKKIKKISLKQALKIKALVNEYWQEYEDRFNNKKYQLLCDILTIIYCKKYNYCILRGCCQSDWIYCVYSSDISDTFIIYIESVFFNTGCEVKISDEAIDEEEIKNIINNDLDYDGYYEYISSYAGKEDLAALIGCDVAAVAFYEISDIKSITSYKISYKEMRQ